MYCQTTRAIQLPGELENMFIILFEYIVTKMNTTTNTNIKNGEQVNKNTTTNTIKINVNTIHKQQ